MGVGGVPSAYIHVYIHAYVHGCLDEEEVRGSRVRHRLSGTSAGKFSKHGADVRARVATAVYTPECLRILLECQVWAAEQLRAAASHGMMA